jgi:putative salt-induced outer membrane protein YdiY
MLASRTGARRASVNLWLWVCLGAASLNGLPAQEPLPTPFAAPETSDPTTAALVAPAEIAAPGLFGGDFVAASPHLFPAFSTSFLDDVSSWIVPGAWVLPSVWERGIELGVNGSEGNAQSFSLLAAGRIKRKTDRSTLKAELTYGKSEANSVLTQHYGFLDSRWDLKLGNARWTYFNLLQMSFDEFKPFDYRINFSAGLGYDFIQHEQHKLTGRFGAGASRELGGATQAWVPESTFGGNYEHQLSRRQKVLAAVDYFPSWENFMDYRVVGTASWEFLLDQETNLSLKLGMIDRFDSTPANAKANDVDYFLTLLWKL